MKNSSPRSWKTFRSIFSWFHSIAENIRLKWKLIMSDICFDFIARTRTNMETLSGIYETSRKLSDVKDTSAVLEAVQVRTRTIFRGGEQNRRETNFNFECNENKSLIKISLSQTKENQVEKRWTTMESIKELNIERDEIFGNSSFANESDGKGMLRKP